MCDWTALEHEYVTGTDSYRDLAKKYESDPDVTKGKIERYGKKNNWPDKRIAHQDEIKTESVRLTAKIKSEYIAELSELVHGNAVKLMRKMSKDLDSREKIKPSEFRSYADAIDAVAKLLPDTEEEQQTAQTLYVAMLPERTEIDDPEGR